MYHVFRLSFLLLLSFAVQAEELKPADAPPPPPKLSTDEAELEPVAATDDKAETDKDGTGVAGDNEGVDVLPDVTIVRKGEKTIQEFRRNGKLYMVKVLPDKGPAYYFIDTDGDGNLDVRGSDLEKGINIHQWKILEWNLD